MPAYNVEKHISTAIESVLAQTISDWELIVVNDGSPDNSKEIAETYAAQDDRIRVVSKKNGGLSDARNYGLQFATGEYIHFFDSDDRILPRHYELYLPTLESNPDIVIAGYQVEYLDNNNYVENLIKRNLPIQTGNEINPCHPIDVIQFVCYAWNKLFKRSFLIKNHLLYEKGLSRIEDAEFMSRFIEHAPKVKFSEKGEYVYVQRTEITLSKGFDPAITGILKRRKEIDKKLIFFFNKGLSDREKEIIEKLLNASALRSAINRLFDSAPNKESLSANLKRIKSYLMTDNMSFSNRSIVRKYYDYIIYHALKHNLYSIIKLLQNFR
ncbi:MAG: glycosyltransferase [Bacteroides sp.]|nr:glycosyltransferase [Bacteroides sp.]